MTGLTASMIAAEQMPKAKILLLEKLSATGGNSNFAEINAPARATTYAAARQKALDMFKASTYLKDPALLVNLYLDAAKNSAWLFTKHGVLLDETHMYYETRNGAKSMAKLTSQIKSDSAYANVEIRLNTRATALLLASDHKCTGVQALDVVSGAYKNINAKAVLLATAGMGTNLDLLSYYTGEDVQQKCLGLGAGQDGDGHLMVEQTAHGMCKGVYPTGMFHNVKGFSFSSPLGVAVALQPTNVWVNQRGERFVNEEATSVYPFIPAGKAIETEGYCFSIFGQNLKKYFETKGSDALWYYYYKTPTSLDSDLAKYKDNKYVFTAPTLEGLAQAMGVPSDTFVNTIKAYEANVTAGTGDSVLGKTAKYMVSLGDGPYYGFRIFSGIIQTNGGIRIDESCRVCDPFFTPIEGLYAGGISVHGFNVEVYSTGTSQAVALWSGSVAARHAVANLLGGTVAKNWYGDKEYDGPLADRTTANPLKQLLGNEPK
ncbi:MAG: FAD-binding protein [Coriobacteriia bacterium]|nr:FAD-binding protein [Coriobacteriia bacterium]